MGFYIGLATMLVGGFVVHVAVDGSAVSILSVIIGAATVTQAVVAVVMIQGLRHARDQAEAARLSIDLIRLNSQRQLRAYMGVDSARLLNVDEADRKMQLVMKNSGQTPARNVELSIWGDFIETSALQQWEPVLRPASVRAMLTAGATTTATLTTRQWAYHAERVAKGEVHLVLAGVIAYEDVFGERHELRFRRIHQPWVGDDALGILGSDEED
ncbi:MAG: hypothetical protein ACOY5Y_02190 [Pseudomonadota bacterium]